MSIGDRWSNYAGGNLFPYEYRSFGYLKNAYVIIPENYSHVNTSVQQYRTRRTNSSVTQTVNNIVPTSTNGDTLFYNIEQLYTSGQLEYSDDGFSGNNGRDGDNGSLSLVYSDYLPYQEDTSSSFFTINELLEGVQLVKQNWDTFNGVVLAK